MFEVLGFAIGLTLYVIIKNIFVSGILDKKITFNKGDKDKDVR